MDKKMIGMAQEKMSHTSLSEINPVPQQLHTTMALLKKAGEADKTSSILDDLPRIELLPNMPLIQHKGFWFSPNLVKSLLLIETQYKTLPTDVLISSFPKSGTTWLKAITFAILHNHTIINPLQTHNPHQLVPFLESQTFGENPTWKVDEIPSPRIFSTHIPYSLLPKTVTENYSGCKIIHISRSPADIIVSSWHFREKAFKIRETLEEYFNEFIKGIVVYGPLLEHVLEYWEAREKENILFITYEGLKKNPNNNVKKIAEFLGCSLSNDEIDRVVRKTSFKHLSKLDVNTHEDNRVFISKDRSVPHNAFFRNGNVGDGKNCLTPEMIERLNAAIYRKWGGTGLELLDRQP